MSNQNRLIRALCSAPSAKVVRDACWHVRPNYRKTYRTSSPLKPNDSGDAWHGAGEARD